MALWRTIPWWGPALESGEGDVGSQPGMGHGAVSMHQRVQRTVVLGSVSWPTREPPNFDLERPISRASKVKSNLDLDTRLLTRRSGTPSRDC